MYFLFLAVSLVVSTSAVDCVDDGLTCYVSSGMINSSADPQQNNDGDVVIDSVA